MPKFECKREFNHKGTKYRKGDIIKLTGKYAEIYMQNNWIGDPKVKKRNTETATVDDKGYEKRKEYPKAIGGGWYELSDGKKVQGEKEAIKLEKSG